MLHPRGLTGANKKIRKGVELFERDERKSSTAIGRINPLFLDQPIIPDDQDHVLVVPDYRIISDGELERWLEHLTAAPIQDGPDLGIRHADLQALEPGLV
jgi:hypothetical protein